MNATTALACAAFLVLAGCSGPGIPDPSTEPVPQSRLKSFDGAGAALPTPPGLAGMAVTVTMVGGPRGAEPNVGTTGDGKAFVTVGGTVRRSLDGGSTWEEVFNLTQFWGPLYDTPLPNNGTVGDPAYNLARSSDPMLWVDPDTDRVFADFMTGLYCSKMFISDDGGDSWTAVPFDCGIPVNDHQKVATSRHGPDAVATENPLYPNVVYYCYNKLVATHCAVSHNGGLSFAYDRPVTQGTNPEGGASPCGGINGHPAGAPDGTVYVPLNLGCPGPVVAVSTDDGLTWTIRAGPTDHGAEEIDPDVTVTPDGTAYMLYRGEDHLQYLVRSPDRFVTWEGPWKVSPPEVRSSVFAGITSGDDGRIAMAFLGTRDTDEDPSHAPDEARWHLYQVVSLDANASSPTFTSLQVTPDADPVQIGCVWLQGGGNPCRNLLDFIDMTRDPEGRSIVAFTDGCDRDCAYNTTATHEQSRSRAVAVAVLSGGPSLLASTSPHAKP